MQIFRVNSTKISRILRIFSTDLIISTEISSTEIQFLSRSILISVVIFQTEIGHVSDQHKLGSLIYNYIT